ncbi:amidohydrolase [Ectobacillus antri]|jgi:predicted amidohydrolase YtcJ|uniref:Amidohydrolase n=1 Tax=Ectobacillus antri TaxID=2486280 RepID=A0ABT6H2C1_9BACI|nr:amidohydrolase [Ectobacillus antri]MDG4656505.1 amidohydrolase [Ectobacillus antri]MDG5753555.1 amidohydrolase [Ectobacillus antri]
MGELWYGGRIYTMEQEGETVEAVYVANGKIVETGTAEALSRTYQVDTYHDLQGQVMLPGLTDSHMHLIGHGERLMRLDLSYCTSYEEMLGLIADKAANTPSGEWIIGEGWNENAFTDCKTIHKKDLDRITSEHPIVLKRMCRHVVLVNSYVLDQLQLPKDNPKGGKIGRDITGEPNGLLYERAQELLDDMMPTQSDAYLQKALETAVADCYSKGLVGCHTEDLNYYGGFAQTYHAFVKGLSDKPFKAHLLVHHEVVDELPQYESTRYIEFGAMKIFADGSLGGRTALLSEPYADEDTKGVAVFEREELAQLVKKAREMGLTVAVHTIGDLSFEYIVEAIEKHPPYPGQRDRIIHCQVLRKDLIERAKLLPVVLDLQPVFVTSDFPSVIEKLGPDRLQYAYAWKTLLQEGFMCAGGSDAPIEDVNPFLGIYGAVTRKSLFDGMVYMPEERLSVFEALQLFTIGSALAIYKENERGKIVPGYDADFTIIDRDPFTIEADELLHIKACMTVVDGKIVYNK